MKKQRARNLVVVVARQVGVDDAKVQRLLLKQKVRRERWECSTMESNHPLHPWFVATCFPIHQMSHHPLKLTLTALEIWASDKK